MHPNAGDDDEKADHNVDFLVWGSRFSDNGWGGVPKYLRNANVKWLELAKPIS